MTTLRSTAALVGALLALSGCKDINAGMNLLEGKPADATPLALAFADAPAVPEPEPGYTVLDGTGPMGEEIGTGRDCVPMFRQRICV